MTSPKKLADIMIDFYTKKPRIIREGFDSYITLAARILKCLIPKPTSTFDFRETSVPEVYDVIDRCKTSKSTGNDKMSNPIMKEIPQYMARVICHLFNSMVRKSKFPMNMKISRIIPTKKNGKQSNLKESFRPISNLPACEKILRDYKKTAGRLFRV